MCCQHLDLHGEILYREVIESSTSLAAKAPHRFKIKVETDLSQVMEAGQGNGHLTLHTRSGLGHGALRS